MNEFYPRPTESNRQQCVFSRVSCESPHSLWRTLFQSNAFAAFYFVHWSSILRWTKTLHGSSICIQTRARTTFGLGNGAPWAPAIQRQSLFSRIILKHFAHYGRRIMHHRFPIRCENVHLVTFFLRRFDLYNKLRKWWYSVPAMANMQRDRLPFRTTRRTLVRVKVDVRAHIQLIGENEIYVVPNYHRMQRQNITACLLLRKQFEANNLWKRLWFPYNAQAHLVSFHMLQQRYSALPNRKEMQKKYFSSFDVCVNVYVLCV